MAGHRGDVDDMLGFLLLHMTCSQSVTSVATASALPPSPGKRRSSGTATGARLKMQMMTNEFHKIVQLPSAVAVACSDLLGDVIIGKPTASCQKMIQHLFPNLHEFLIMFHRELRDKLIACRTEAGVAIGDVGKATSAVWRKLNAQPAGRHTRQNLQHFNEQFLRLVTCNVPNCSSKLVRRKEDAITLGNTGNTDDKLRQPPVRPFRFSHRA